MLTNYLNKNSPITSLIYGIRGGVANKNMNVKQKKHGKKKKKTTEIRRKNPRKTRNENNTW